MDIKEKIQLHQELIDELHKLYVSKNSDYGDSVHETFKRYGLTAFLVRIEDKLNRARTLGLGKAQEVNDESLKDTLSDLANYALLAIIELEDSKKS